MEHSIRPRLPGPRGRRLRVYADQPRRSRRARGRRTPVRADRHQRAARPVPAGRVRAELRRPGDECRAARHVPRLPARAGRGRHPQPRGGHGDQLAQQRVRHRARPALRRRGRRGRRRTGGSHRGRRGRRPEQPALPARHPGRLHPEPERRRRPDRRHRGRRGVRPGDQGLHGRARLPVDQGAARVLHPRGRLRARPHHGRCPGRAMAAGRGCPATGRGPAHRSEDRLAVRRLRRVLRDLGQPAGGSGRCAR